MKVLVTGAAGKLGRATCSALTAAGIDFVATDARTSREIPYRVRVANLLDREGCYGLLEDCDALVHLANHPNQHAATPQRIFAENCAMNINVFQAALELGVRKIVYASSIQAINGGRLGEQESTPSRLKYLPLDGDSPAQPANAYAASKVAAEILLRSMVEHQGLASAIAVRWPSMVLKEWRQYIRERLNTGSTVRQFFLDEAFAWLDMEDGGRLVAAILQAQLPGYRCYLPAAPAPVLEQPLPTILARFYKDVPLRRPANELTSLTDISRITAETNWTPSVHSLA